MSGKRHRPDDGAADHTEHPSDRAYLMERAISALHLSAAPTSCPCRDSEKKAIEDFLCSALSSRQGGSMYVCGSPGAGKTACTTEVVERVKTWAMEPGSGSEDVSHVFVNAMKLLDPNVLYSKIVEEATGQWLAGPAAKAALDAMFQSRDGPAQPQGGKQRGGKTPAVRGGTKRKSAGSGVRGGAASASGSSATEKEASVPGIASPSLSPPLYDCKMVLLVVDETDQLVGQHLPVLHNLFRWASRAPPDAGTHQRYRMAFLGLANNINLVDKLKCSFAEHVPRLSYVPERAPVTVVFGTYDKAQLVTIVESRLAHVVAELEELEAQNVGEEEEDAAAAAAAAAGGAPPPPPPPLIQPKALALCAQKIATQFGDTRRMLEICRVAFELSLRAHKAVLLKLEEAAAFQGMSAQPSSSSSAASAGAGASSNVVPLPTVTVVHVNKALQAAFTSPCVPAIQKLTMHQKIMLCVVAVKLGDSEGSGGSSSMLLGALQSAYGAECRKSNMAKVGNADFTSFADLLQENGLVLIKKTGSGAKQDYRKRNMEKVVLNDDVRFALEDDALCMSILNRAAAATTKENALNAAH